ncbi:MAG: hypothetical protein JNK48_33135 [Bryobacterales bacterium]|nr:hypothetical protein [Bryobacterales bacterium]
MEAFDDLIQFSLDHETLANESEQLEWIAREPANAQPFYNLAQLRRMQYKQDEGLALLLHAIALQPTHAPAHVALAEIYAVRADYRAAWTHALAADEAGHPAALQMLERHRIPRP